MFCFASLTTLNEPERLNFSFSFFFPSAPFSMIDVEIYFQLCCDAVQALNIQMSAAKLQI